MCQVVSPYLNLTFSVLNVNVKCNTYGSLGQIQPRDTTLSLVKRSERQMSSTATSKNTANFYMSSANNAENNRDHAHRK